MTALPEHPTERDRERFRDLTKAMGYPLEYARCGQHEAYSDAITHMVFEVWWKAERERQLLQNLNQSQGVKLTEWENKYAVLANEYQSTCAAANDTLERLEKSEESLRSLASFVGAGGYNADKVDADVFEQKIRWGIGQIMERLEKAQMEIEALSTENGFVHQRAEEDKKELREQLEAERKRLDWALETGLGFGDLVFDHISRGECPRATIDELIAGEKK